MRASIASLIAMTTIDSSPIQLQLDTDTPPGPAVRKPDEAAGKSAFAEVFAGLLPEAPRPAVKPTPEAPREPEPELLVSPVMLQRVALSPAMQLIMPATPAPDLASLQAFARSQGLDEQAIQQLLGDGQGPGQAVGLPVTAQNAAGDAVEAEPVVALAAIGALLGGVSPLGVALAGEPGVEPGSPQLTAPGLLPAGLIRAVQPGRPGVAGPQAPMNAKTGWEQPVEVISLDLTGADAPADPEGQPPALGLKGGEALHSGMLRAWLLPGGQPTPLNEGAAPTQGMAVVSRAAGATAMMAGDLARLDPSALARNDPLASGEGGSLQDGLLKPLLPTDGPKAAEGAVMAGRHTAIQDAAAMAGRAPAEAALPGGAGKDMAEHLAQRLGEAIAQRLMSRLEQGNWQFRFVLNPKTMGEVQVNLHMHSGGLDGSFVSSQSATRELLNEGLQRLRDTLNASGMNVASLDVGAGHSSRQGQQPMPNAVAQPLPGSRSQAAAAQPEPGPVRHRDSLGGEQGWDVLV